MRWWATITLKLFGLRTSRKRMKDKICLSFYVVEDNLNLSSVTIEQPDIYFMYWLEQLMPMYDPENYLEKIYRANSWVKKYLPNAFGGYKMFAKYELKDGKVSGKIKTLLEKMWAGAYGNLIENQAEGIQRTRLKMSFSNLDKEDGTKVILDDKMLKFHENDRRQEYKNKWEENCKKYVV